jgi:hypothetical protein
MSAMRVLFLLAVLAISACANQAPLPQAARPPNPELACVEAVARRADLAPIAGKIWLGGALSQPAAFFALADKASESDKLVIAAWVNLRRECSRQGQAWVQQYAPPEFAALVSKSNSAYLSLTADLYAGKISYGDYAKARAKLFRDGEREAEAISK